MWQVDNDRYQLWRLEQQLAPKRIDSLLDSAALRRFPKVLDTPFRAVPIVRRAHK